MWILYLLVWTVREGVFTTVPLERFFSWCPQALHLFATWIYGIHLLRFSHLHARVTHTATRCCCSNTHSNTSSSEHAYISRRDKRRSTPPATTGIDLVAGALLPLVVYELTGLQRGGTPSKPAGFGATDRSREVQYPPRGLRR